MKPVPSPLPLTPRQPGPARQAGPTTSPPVAIRHSPLFLPLIFLTVLVIYGIAEGFWTNRWIPSAELERATERLAQVPRVVGDWQGTDQELDARTIAVSELTGYVMRRYVNQRTGAAISMLLVCGKPGPTTQHTPEVCYVGAGFTATAAPVHASIDTKESALGDFWLAHYTKGSPAPEALRIYWAWNATGTWQAAARPRFDFAHHAALYKLYVVRQLPKADEPLADDPAAHFLEIFLPVLQHALFANGDERVSGGRRAPSGESKAVCTSASPVLPIPASRAMRHTLSAAQQQLATYPRRVNL